MEPAVWKSPRNTDTPIAVQFIAALITERYNIYYARCCLRQRSGLIKYDRICFCHRLQELATLHRDA